jgi:hypothetical protein
VLEWSYDTDLRVVLLLDEFHNLLQKDNFTDVFHGTFRTLYSRSKLSFVFSTRSHHLEQPGNKSASYFTNATLKQDLDLFTEQESRELLQQKSNLPFTDEETRIGLMAGQNHPWRLQMAGFHIYQYKREQSPELYDAQGNIRFDALDIIQSRVDEEYNRVMGQYLLLNPAETNWRSNDYEKNLRLKLVKHFNLEELRTLCQDLGIDYENFPTEKESMSREFIKHVSRYAHFPQLLKLLAERRPNVEWEDV